MRFALLIILALAVVCSGCSNSGSNPVSNSGSTSEPSTPSKGTYDTNVSVPKGDPDFPPLGQYWVVDKADLLSQNTIEEGDAICQRLQDDKVAEVVIVVMNGVKYEPVRWATSYGRHEGIGRKGMATEGGQDGVVWLIRPDADEKIIISVGRGLPKFTATDYGEIMDDVKDYVNFNNYDKGVLILIRETDKRLRELYGNKKRTNTESEEHVG